MRKLLSLFAIAALLMMLGGCSKEEKDPDPPVNDEQVFGDVECSSCHTHYRVKGQTWLGNGVAVEPYTAYPSANSRYSVYTLVGSQEDQDVPFFVSSNTQYLKWNCVGSKDGGVCGRELKVEFDIKKEDVMPQTREHLLL